MKSVKGQLLVIFLSFIVISLLTALFTASHYQKKQDLTELDTRLHELEVLLLQAIKEQENFFNFETVNESYYLSGESTYLKQYRAKINQLKRMTKSLSEERYIRNQSKTQLASIRAELLEFESSFKAITNAVKHRGFRDYGLIGEMRKAAHQLEDDTLLHPSEILMLRRHEKDFIIRQDDIYLVKHAAFLQECLQNIRQQENSRSEHGKLSKKVLIEYDSLFKSMARLDKAIGLKTNRGMKQNLNQNINRIVEFVDLLKVDVHNHQDQELQKLNFSLISFWIVYLILSIWMCFKISGKFTKRISHLTRHINYFVNTNFTARMDTDVKISKDEIGMLWGNFLKMENEIVEYLDLFKEKVDEKTKELSERNQLIEAQKAELEIKKSESEERNKDLMDGMKYGWRIQNALLPSKVRFSKQVEQGFIFFQPKDIVSGDVYFTHKLTRREGVENIFSVIDCTGHGVPGAFMSILAMNSVNNAVLTVKHREPHYILQEANNFVYSSLKYYLNDFNKDHNTKDGMDMLVCRLKRDTNQLSYAGANRPLYLVRKSKKDKGLGLENKHYRIIEVGDCKLFEIFPVKKTVGTVHPEESELFDKLDIKVQKGDMLYLSSDGYADQFGGPSDKKFMTKKLKKFLCSIHELSVDEQRTLLANSFDSWKGENDQIDDVCILGVRV